MNKMSLTAETDLYTLPLTVRAENVIAIQVNLKEEPFRELYNISFEKTKDDVELNIFDANKEEYIINCKGTVEEGIKSCKLHGV